MDRRTEELVKRAIAEGEQDRAALILSDAWEPELMKNDDLCRVIIEYLRVGGILVRKGAGVLFHCTLADRVQSILSEGLRVLGEPEDYTFGGDVIYAWPEHDPAFDFPGCAWLKVTVSAYMKAVVTVDKDELNQHECIFAVNDIISIEEE